MKPTNYCPECETQFTAIPEDDRAFFPVLYCPFCGVELDDQDIVEELSFGEDD